MTLTRGAYGKKVPASVATERIRKYLDQANHYRENAHQLWTRGDDAKAGEAAWGAVVSALKALSLAHAGRVLRAGEVGGYGSLVARRLRRVEEYASVQALHANFYDQFRDKDSFRVDMEKALRFLDAVLEQVLRRDTQDDATPSRTASR